MTTPPFTWMIWPLDERVVQQTRRGSWKGSYEPDVTGICRGEEHEAGSDLDGLARATHRHLRAELLDAILGHRRRADMRIYIVNRAIEEGSSRRSHQRRPDRPGRDGIAPNAFLTDDLVAQRAHERYDRALGRGVVEQVGVADRHVDRGVERDRRRGRLGEVRDRGLGDVEEGVDVRVEGVAPVLGGELGDVADGVLVSVVQDAAGGSRFRHAFEGSG